MAGRVVVGWIVAIAVVLGAVAWLAHRMNTDDQPATGSPEPVEITDSGVRYERGEQVFSADYAIRNDEGHAVTYTVVFDFENGTTRTVTRRVASGVSVRGTVDTPFEKSRPSAEGTPSEVRVADISTSE
ncbi:hypothetical protein [Streptomyces sp. WP-1]|uniref:hypothetical protein n=1 Tax=Streptomyces sp. WP-1 TaxID=3041497 RepID=UPI0026490CE9|nr:hypothetical protein [Streptomyces sp. WP-1]WKE68910.1 hypothetical protein QHG49_07690 [Streptomyces sp. WP-1]